MNRHSYHTIVTRDSRDETTFAIVEAVTWGDDPLTDEEFIATLRKAITAWVDATGPGMSAWENSNEDFNVGDLADEVGDTELVAILKKHGITDLDIQCITSSDFNRHWTYDTILAAPADRSDDPPHG